MGSNRLRSVTIFAASGAGRSHYALPDGQSRFPFGLEVRPVSHSVKRVKVRVRKMKGISGLISTGLSPSAGPRLSLASRLEARLDVSGSLEYTLTWKRSAIECHETNRGTMSSTTFRLRARGRRTSDSVYSGWPSPRERDHHPSHTAEYKGDFRTDLGSVVQALAGWRTPTASEKVRSKEFAVGREPGPMELRGYPTPNAGDAKAGISPRGEQSRLGKTAMLTGWSTPTVTDHSRGAKPPRPQDTGTPLTQQVSGLTGWGTPRVTTNGGHPSPQCTGKGSRLEDQAALASTSFTAETAKHVASTTLNASFSRWLMGFPPIWDIMSPGFVEWMTVQAELIKEE